MFVRWWWCLSVDEFASCLLSVFFLSDVYIDLDRVRVARSGYLAHEHVEFQVLDLHESWSAFSGNEAFFARLSTAV